MPLSLIRRGLSIISYAPIKDILRQLYLDGNKLINLMNFSYLSCVFENNKRRIKLFLESVVNILFWLYLVKR